MANVKNNAAAQATQRRLLEAAGEVFAARGFYAATIKEITDRANASVASIHYHFRDKAELYAAVLRRVEADCRGVLASEESLTGDAHARLRQSIRHVAATLLGRNRPVWERVLLTREFAQPTPALDPLVEAVARPLHDALARRIAEATGRSPRDEAVGMECTSIVGLCIFYTEHQAVIQRLHPRLGARWEIERVADHIAEFCLASLGLEPKGARKGKPGQPPAVSVPHA